MRNFIVAVAVVLALVVSLLVAAALSLNRIIAGNRDRLLQRAQSAIGRPLSVERITLSLWGGLGVRLENVGIADDPRFDRAEFVQAVAITARAKLWPLLRGQLQVASVDAMQPQIHLVRNETGLWNYTSLTLGAGPTEPASGTEPAAGKDAPVGSQTKLPWFLGLVNIADGAILVSDRTAPSPQDMRITHVDLRLRDVSRSTAITFDLGAGLQSDERNVSLRGTLGPFVNPGAIPVKLAGSVGPLGPHQLHIDHIQAQAEITPDLVRATQLEGRAFGGTFNFSATYPLRASGAASLKGQVAHAALAPIAQMLADGAPQKIEGIGQLSLDLHATGGSGERIRSSLAGSVTAAVENAVLRDFNLVDEVLGRATGLPDIGALISQNVKPKYARVFSAPDTRFDTVRATFTIADQRLHTDDCVLAATDYGARVSGWLTFNRDADLSGTLALSKPLSADVVAHAKEAKYLLDRNGQLAVPFHLRGKLGEAKPVVDSGFLVDALARSLSQGSGARLLDKLLGGKPHAPQAPVERAKPLQNRLRDIFGH